MNTSDLIDSIIMDLLKLKKVANWEPAEEDVGWTIRVTDSLTGKSTVSTFKTTPNFYKQAEIDKAYRTMNWLLREPTAEERKRAEDDGPSYHGDPYKPFYTD